MIAALIVLAVLFIGGAIQAAIWYVACAMLYRIRAREAARLARMDSIRGLRR